MNLFDRFITLLFLFLLAFAFFWAASPEVFTLRPLVFI